MSLDLYQSLTLDAQRYATRLRTTADRVENALAEADGWYRLGVVIIGEARHRRGIPEWVRDMANKE